MGPRAERYYFHLRPQKNALLLSGCQSTDATPKIEVGQISDSAHEQGLIRAVKGDRIVRKGMETVRTSTAGAQERKQVLRVKIGKQHFWEATDFLDFRNREFNRRSRLCCVYDVLLPENGHEGAPA